MAKNGKLMINLPEINFYYGNSVPIVTISLKNIILKQDITTFLSNYNFSKWKKGKFYLKRIINKIFIKKLNQEMIWERNFWESIEVQKFETNIQYNISQTNISIMKSLHKNQSKKRLQNIYDYKKLIMNGIDLGSPLYIKGNCLNKLGGNVEKEKLFQLDGSRRLCAYLLNNKAKLNIWLISLK